MPAYRCAGPGCQRGRRSNHLMCPSCWAQVPADIQKQINASWTPGTIRQTAAWSNAVDAAIASLRPTGTEELPL